MQKYARQSKLTIYKYSILNVLLLRLTIAQLKNKHSDFMNVFCIFSDLTIEKHKWWIYNLVWSEWHPMFMYYKSFHNELKVEK